MITELIPAKHEDLEELYELVTAYHAFENFELSPSTRKKAIANLLVPNSESGKIWLVSHNKEVVGYIVLCYGYSIEHGGKDAFIDEFYLIESARGKGIGESVLELVKAEAKELSIHALHLLVALHNNNAKKLYIKSSFRSRNNFQLMSCPL